MFTKFAKKMAQVYLKFILSLTLLTNVNSQQQYSYPQQFPAALPSPTGISGLSSQFLLSILRGIPRDPPACNFGCPTLGQFASPRLGHIPMYNGCGSYGFERLLVPEMDLFVDCCNAHDICYDTCGASKVECDNSFHNCLLNRCGNIVQNFALPANLASNCMSTAQLLGTGPVVAGCNAFIIAQTNACECSY